MARKVMNGLDLQSQRIVSLGDPSGAQDAASKNYVDNVARGLDWKQSVRAASTGNVSVASAPASIDGVTLAANDRVLLMNQTAPAENGIYTFASAGAALTRAVDADASSEVTSGMAVTATEGTTNGDKTFVLTTNDPITLGTTGLTFTGLGGGIVPSAGNGLTGGTTSYDVGAGTGIVVAADSVAIDTAVVVRKFAANVGDGASTTITVNHNLGTRDVEVTVYTNGSPYDEVVVDVQHTDANNVALLFAVAPASAAYRCVVQG